MYVGRFAKGCFMRAEIGEFNVAVIVYDQNVRCLYMLLYQYMCFLRYSSLNLINGPPRKGPKHVVVFFNNLKIQLCYDGRLYT
jgi:hypothetical protein